MINQQQPLAVGQVGQIDMCTLQARVVFNVTGLDTALIDVTYPGVAWPTSAVVTIKHSANGVTFEAFSPTITKTAVGSTDMIVVSGLKFLAAEITTIGSGTSPIPFNVRCTGK